MPLVRNPEQEHLVKLPASGMLFPVQSRTPEALSVELPLPHPEDQFRMAMACKKAYYDLSVAATRAPWPSFASILRRHRKNRSRSSLIVQTRRTYETRLAGTPDSRPRRTPSGMTFSSTLSSSARTEPLPSEKADAGYSNTKTTKPGDTGHSFPPSGTGGHPAAAAATNAAKADSTSTGSSSTANDSNKSERVVLGPLGESRKPQRVEVEFGNFHEFTAINKTGGKLFEASRELIPAQEALLFPTIKASSLAGGADVDFPSRLKGRVTLVGLFHRQFGYSMLPTWMKPFEEAFGVPGTGSTGGITPSTVQISLLESWSLRLLRPVLVPSMALGVAKEKKASFYYRFGNTDEFRKVLGIENRLTLYTVLVDQEGRVRWWATGKGTPDELESVIRCARQLADGRG